MAKFFKPQKRAQSTRQRPLQTAEVEALDHQGRGVVRQAAQQGKVHTYFIDGVLPGEIIRFRPTGKLQAECHKVEQAATARQQPPCQYYQHCGGCDLQHLTIAAQRQHKQTTISQLLAKFAGCDSSQLNWHPPLTAEQHGYRRKARLAVYWQPRQQQLRLGFREPKSKRITAIDHCWVLEPALDKLLVPLQQCLQMSKIGQQLGHVELINTTTAHVVLRLLAPLSAVQVKQLTEFAEHYSVTVWLHNDDGITPLDSGSDAVDESIDGDSLYYTVGDFLQVNADINRQMVEQAIAWLAPETDQKVLDLFAGIGNFTLPLARRSAAVQAVEGVARMSERLQDNARQSGLANVSASSADLSQVTAKQLAHYQADLWLLDPARAGAEQVAKQLSNLPLEQQPKRILYVSCAPDTLARDSHWILAAGYQIKQLGLVDMFPQTHHIETMVCFERAA